MDIVNFPIGSDAKLDVSLASGNLVITITVGAQAPVDLLLQQVRGKLPPELQPVLDLVKHAADSALK